MVTINKQRHCLCVSFCYFPSSPSSEQTALNSISPYLPRMVASMPGVPPGQSGLYVGLLASAFALAQLSTNFLWGYASDLVGRKPVLLAGTGCLATYFAVFGFCRRYWHAVFAHVAMGLLNGNAACVPSVLGELTDRSNQSMAFTYLPIIYSLGAITGPALGGLLVDRTGGSRYPLLAPNVFAAAFLAVSVMVVAVWFEETLDDESVSGPWRPLWVARLSGWLRGKVQSFATHRNSWCARWPYNWRVDRQQQPQRQPLLSATCSHSSCTSISSSSFPTDANNNDVCNHSSCSKTGSHADANSPIWRDLLNRTTITLLATYLVFQLSNISFNSLYPIFAAAAPPAGRGLDPGNIGVTLSGAGLATIIFQVFFYQPLKTHAGNLGTYRLALMGIAVSMALMPWLGYLEDGRIWLYAELGVILILKNVCAISGLSSVMLLVLHSRNFFVPFISQDSCVFLPDMICLLIFTGATFFRTSYIRRLRILLRHTPVLGTLNGVAQTLSALGRSFGPFASGGLFTLSLSVRPKGEVMAWSVFGGLALIGWVGSLFIHGDGFESEDLSDNEGDESEDSDEDCNKLEQPLRTCMGMCLSSMGRSMWY